MTRRKVSAACVLLLMTMVFFTGTAPAASILERASQIAQVVSPASNDGSFPISSMMVVKAKGELEPIPIPVPENEVFIVTRIIGYFIAEDPNLTAGTTFNLGDYYRMSPQLTHGFSSFADSLSPGVPITNLDPLVFLHLASDSKKTPIPGMLNLRVMGYTANIN